MVRKSDDNERALGWLYRPEFPGGWDRFVLYDLAKWTNGMAFRNIHFSPAGRPVIKIAEVKNGISGQTKFTEAEYGPCYFVTPGDMLFSWSGQPETSIDVFWWNGPEGWLNQHVFKVEVDTENCDEQFFYYILKYLKPHFIGIARNKQTTGLGHVTKMDLQNITVGLPRKPEQKAIAHILGTLDDKIELNRRMNETLEQVARALFQSWFIDFDPVRRNMARKAGQNQPSLHYRGGYDFSGLVETARRLRKKQTPAEDVLWALLRNRRFLGLKFRRQHQIGDYVADFYCHEAALVVELDGGVHGADRQVAKDGKRDAYLRSLIAAHVAEPLPSPPGRRAGDEGCVEAFDALFPDSFQDSPLGPIPEGWEVRSLAEGVELVKGRSYKSSELQDSDTALVTLKSFQRGGGYRPDGLKAYTGPYKPDQIVLPGEIVVACTDVTQAAEVIGKPAIVRGDERFETLVASLDTMIVRPNREKLSVPFLYCLFLTDDFQAHTYSYTKGTTVLHLAKEALPLYEFAWPPSGLLSRFAGLAEPTFARIEANERETATLAAIRDALLPKLLSGEIRIPDAEKCVQETGP